MAETVLIETKEVLKGKFPGFEEPLDIFLDRIDFELVRMSEISSRIVKDSEKVRDRKDAPIYAAVALTRPDYVISGDATLRSDLANSSEIFTYNKVCSSREFLTNFP
ncbi:MAG: hypothetical protein ACRECH_01865 [Nitrososphaerales archaeon]